MKRAFVPLIILMFGANQAVTQTTPFEIGVPWAVQVLKSGAFNGYPGKLVTATIQYKDTSGIVRYTEDHSGLLDDFSYLKFIIGKGANQNPPGGIHPAEFIRIDRLCWTATISTDDGPVTLMGDQDLWTVPRAVIAAHAYDSERLGGAVFNSNVLGVDDFVNSPGEQYGLTSWRNHDLFKEYRPVDTWNFIRTDPATSVVTGNPLNAVRIGKGTFWPFVFGSMTPTELENLYTVCVPPLTNYRHGLGVKVAQNTGTHNTAAIFADNTASQNSAGLLANALTWGVYGTGQSGVVGISSGTGNGACLTGFVAVAPDDGGFKYGLYGNSNGVTGAWAGAFFGNSFYTGTFAMSSDARLKLQVTPQSGMLDRVLALKPSTYQYRQDTPYGLPSGVHHGFLAQDVEVIFPELVTATPFPQEPDPQKLHQGGVIEYKGVNYIEIIAILTGAIQEMHQHYTEALEKQAKEIEELREAIKEIK